MDERELRRIYKNNKNPRDSKILTDTGFVRIDNGSEGGIHWTCFIVKDNKSYYFDCFGGQPDKFRRNQLLKPIIYHNYKTQDRNAQNCVSYRLYFFYLYERMKYFDIILKLVFE